MTAKRKNSDSRRPDQNDAPELTDADLARGTWRIGERKVTREEAMAAIARRRPGRPSGSNKTSTTIRFDRDMLEAFRRGGPGWQSRINAALRDWLRRHPA